MSTSHQNEIVVPGRKPVMATGGSTANRRRIEEDQKELERLMGLSGKKPQKTEEPVKVEEEKTEVRRVEVEPSEEPEMVEEKKGTSGEEDTASGFEKRYKDAQRYITKLNKRVAELEAAQKKSVQLPKSEEQLSEWMKKYPDVADIVRTIALKESTPVREQIEEIEREMQKAKTEAAVLKAHSDYHDIMDDPKFHEWADGLSTALQSAIYDDVDRPQDVIHILRMYKAETGKKDDADEPNEKKAASSTKPRRSSAEPDKNGGSRGRVYRESEIKSMNIREYERNYDDIMKARVEGRIEYDLSGGAR